KPAQEARAVCETRCIRTFGKDLARSPAPCSYSLYLPSSVSVFGLALESWISWPIQFFLPTSPSLFFSPAFSLVSFGLGTDGFSAKFKTEALPAAPWVVSQFEF